MCSNFLDKFNKELRVSVGDIDADPREVVFGNEFLTPFPVCLSGTSADSQVIGIERVLILPVGVSIVLHKTSEEFVFSKGIVDTKCSDTVHVGCHDGYAGPGLTTVPKRIRALQCHFSTAAKSTSFGTNQDIFIVQFHIVFESHFPPLEYQNWHHFAILM